MNSICEQSKCTGCFACMNICPMNAISVDRDKLGKTIPQINSHCIECGQCVSVCPANNKLPLYNPITCYAAKSLDDRDKDCSSGGIATVFTRYILNNDGAVFGSRSSTEYMAEHICARSADELKGSKYVQSFTGTTYRQAKERLDNNKNVLYIGTPCQIAGLKAYLKKDYNNLVTVDIICHGVSPAIYLKDYIESLDIGKFDKISFRGKYDYKLSLFYKDNLVYQKSDDEDYYYSSFYKSLISRDNCYDCQYAEVKRVSDITIGDFWGLEEQVLRDRFNGKASVVLINTEKGLGFFEKVKGNIAFTERNIDEAVKGNDQLRHPANKHKLRNKFENEYKINGFAKAIRKVYGRQLFLNKLLKAPFIYQLRQIRYDLKKRRAK